MESKEAFRINMARGFRGKAMTLYFPFLIYPVFYIPPYFIMPSQ